MLIPMAVTKETYSKNPLFDGGPERSASLRQYQGLTLTNLSSGRLWAVMDISRADQPLSRLPSLRPLSSRRAPQEDLGCATSIPAGSSSTTSSPTIRSMSPWLRLLKSPKPDTCQSSPTAPRDVAPVICVVIVDICRSKRFDTAKTQGKIRLVIMRVGHQQRGAGRWIVHRHHGQPDLPNELRLLLRP